jgi:hypothetical protein
VSLRVGCDGQALAELAGDVATINPLSTGDFPQTTMCIGIP